MHPIVHEDVVSELPPARQAALHVEAARLLAAEDLSVDPVAAHLLLAEPDGHDWAVDLLRRAAREALSRGAPEAAVELLALFGAFRNSEAVAVLEGEPADADLDSADMRSLSRERSAQAEYGPVRSAL